MFYKHAQKMKRDRRTTYERRNEWTHRQKKIMPLGGAKQIYVGWKLMYAISLMRTTDKINFSNNGFVRLTTPACKWFLLKSMYTTTSSFIWKTMNLSTHRNLVAKQTRFRVINLTLCKLERILHAYSMNKSLT